MILVLLTYILVKLHDRFRLVVWLCRPINVCLRCFRKEWDVKNSLIGAFATLMLLSYVKILSVTAGILTPAYLYYMNGTHSSLYVFNDINTPYLSGTHLPYFITAILTSFFFLYCRCISTLVTASKGSSTLPDCTLRCSTLSWMLNKDATNTGPDIFDFSQPFTSQCRL